MSRLLFAAVIALISLSSLAPAQTWQVHLTDLLNYLPPNSEVIGLAFDEIGATLQPGSCVAVPPAHCAYLRAGTVELIAR